MDKSEILDIISRLLNGPDQTFVLSTLTADGYPDSRLMGNVCDKSLMEVWFTCQVGTCKIDEIASNPKASVYFTQGDVTVWLYGEASVTRDQTVLRQRWDDRMLQIYSGPDAPNLTMILFKPKKVRFCGDWKTYVEFDL